MNDKSKNNSKGININVSPTISPVINQSIGMTKKETDIVNPKPKEKEPWYKRLQAYVAIIGGIIAMIWAGIQIYNNVVRDNKSTEENTTKSKIEQVQESKTNKDSLKINK